MKKSIFKRENVAFGHGNIIFVLNKDNKGLGQQMNMLAIQPVQEADIAEGQDLII